MVDIPFKEKLSRQAVFGMFMKSADPAFVEIAGLAGMDFVILDMEHGPVGIERMQDHVRAANLAGVQPIIRVPALDENQISKALDIGAAGVQIPQVCSARDAERAVRAAKFHPRGSRGVCRFVRAAGYSSVPKEAYFNSANEKSLVIVQLEGREALANLDEILAVEGVDVIFIGPYDLSQSLGVPGSTDDPRVVAHIREIVEKSAAKGIVSGVFTDSPDAVKLWTGAGVRYIAHSVDVGIFYEACRELRELFGRYIGAAD